MCGKRIDVQKINIDDSPTLVGLLGFAIGGSKGRLQQSIQRYRHDAATYLLAATVAHNIVGFAGYSIEPSSVTLMHIAVTPHRRGQGVGTFLLRAIRRDAPAELPIVAETDADALGFYTSNDFDVRSLGKKYWGVERFRVWVPARNICTQAKNLDR